MQLALPISLVENKTFESLIVGQNRQLIEHVQALIRHDFSIQTYSPSQRLCVISGGPSSGKTHLLLSATDYADKNDLSTQYIDAKVLLEFPQSVLHQFADKDVVCIDNINAIQHIKSWQIAIFDLINQFLETRKRLLLFACNKAVNGLEFELTDLLTRLQWGINFTLHELSDDAKGCAIKQRAKQIGLSLQDDCVRFLVTRGNRDLKTLMQNVETLDKASLRQQRKVTLPFLKQVLNL